MCKLVLSMHHHNTMLSLDSLCSVLVPSFFIWEPCVDPESFASGVQL